MSSSRSQSSFQGNGHNLEKGENEQKALSNEKNSITERIALTD